MGHVARTPSESPVKALLYGELVTGSKAVGRHFLRFKDTHVTPSLGIEP